MLVALAARALGLLMLESAQLRSHLRMDADDLVDALLQIVNFCRHASVQNGDTRRIHVNCCLTIALLMQGTSSHHCLDLVLGPRLTMGSLAWLQLRSSSTLHCSYRSTRSC